MHGSWRTIKPFVDQELVQEWIMNSHGFVESHAWADHNFKSRWSWIQWKLKSSAPGIHHATNCLPQFQSYCSYIIYMACMHCLEPSLLYRILQLEEILQRSCRFAGADQFWGKDKLNAFSADGPAQLCALLNWAGRQWRHDRRDERICKRQEKCRLYIRCTPPPPPPGQSTQTSPLLHHIGQ